MTDASDQTTPADSMRVDVLRGSPRSDELAALIAQDAERKFGEKGRVHFNVGGSQAVEDSLKLVRNFKKGKSLMFAFEGGYHGRTLGASAITSSYRYRRRYGHFGERAHLGAELQKTVNGKSCASRSSQFFF